MKSQTVFAISLLGVFTISDELLAEAAEANFSVLKDEEINHVPVNSVVSKIEEKLKSSIAAANSDGATEK